MGFDLVITSILLGVGLAMDAFSVSLANGLAEPDMKKRRMLEIAGTFAVFQFAMPMIGWVIVHKAVSTFGVLERFIPWIALLLLLYIGCKMLHEGVQELREKRSDAKDSEADAAEALGGAFEAAGASEFGSTDSAGKSKLGFKDLMIQGVATSIDALSVGFTIEKYGTAEALTSSAIIGIVTLGICLVGLVLGRKIGTKLSGKAAILGGVILILIGLEIWVKGVFF